MSFPPVSSLQPSGAFTPEEALDVLAYILATDSATSPPTSSVQWIVGDVGMGPPTQLPFGFISLFNEMIQWETSQGGRGGLSAGGSRGLDNWQSLVTLTVAFAKHDYVPPAAAQPPAASPVSAHSLGVQPPFFEQPGWRLALQMNEAIKAVLRTNITLAGEVATTRVSEARYVLLTIEGSTYRAARCTVQAQQRRPRGN